MNEKQLCDVVIRACILGILLAEGLYIVSLNEKDTQKIERTYYHRDLEGINNGTEGEI
jgi:hypothetical protein